MAETTWSEEGASAPPKKKIPTWLWFCGGGCLLAVLIGVVLVGLGVSVWKTARNPEVQKQRLALILPYDTWPEEMKPVIGFQIVGEQYTFEDKRGFQEQIQYHKGHSGTDGRKRMFGTDNPEFPKDLFVMKFEDLTPGTVEVQGRDLHLVRMRVELSAMFGKKIQDEARDQMGSMVFVDLTPDSMDGMLLLQLTRVKSGGAITDDEIREILKPFHVGPKR